MKKMLFSVNNFTNMIKVIFYVFILTVWCHNGYGQIPKDVNVIIVKGVSYEEVLNRLLDSGYKIDKKDSELKTVLTEHKPYPKYWNAAYRLFIRVKDSIAAIQGTFTGPWDDPFATTASTNKNYLWRDVPIRNHVNKKGVTYPKSNHGYPFLLINDFALSFGRPVEYLKQ